MNKINENEITFTIPFSNNINIFETIENILNELNHEVSDCVAMDIQFDFLDENEERINNDNQNYLQIYNYFENIHNNINNNDYNFNLDHFNYCYEIDQKICKSTKIKLGDPILNEQCLICMDNYKVNELKRELPMCKHYFHGKCINKWLKKSATCPVCRYELLK